VAGSFIAVDTNILVYAHNRASEWHAAARRALEGVAHAPAPWAIAWPCLHEFLAVVTNPRLFRRPEPLEPALKQVEVWMESPGLQLIGEMLGHWTELSRLLRSGRLAGGAVHDARIAAICREHGVTELWTADRDFSRMRGLRVRNPLV
jgi:toxin-antitoxin system PIN domain toxin